jgi:hypothetical protein
MTEVRLSLGIVTFDGRVLELFGFGEQGSRRIHLGQIERIELGRGLTGTQLNVDVAPAGIGLKMAMRLSDEERSALEALIAEVRGATEAGPT